MWFALALAAALFQVLRNTAMKRLGHALDEYINVWGRFTFLLPFALLGCVIGGFPTIKPGFVGWCALFGVSQTLSTLALSKALKLSEISLVTALWTVSLLILLALAWVWIGEHPSPRGVAGVLLSAVGVYLLNVNRARVGFWQPLTVLFTDRDQRYTRLASNAWMGTLGGYLAASAFMTPIVMRTSARRFAQLPHHWKEFVALGDPVRDGDRRPRLRGGATRARVRAGRRGDAARPGAAGARLLREAPRRRSIGEEVGLGLTQALRERGQEALRQLGRFLQQRREVAPLDDEQP
jgi:uncharacterized membrane protein